MDEQLKQTFLALVRLGIGHAVSILPETIDWEKIRVIASNQGLSAIVLDGAQSLMDRGKLSDGRVMDVKLKKQWIGSVIQGYEWKYEDYRKQLGQLARFYNEHGFQLMVLKGYGLGLNYPRPEHRPYGDIDIWAFGKYKEADAVLSKELSITIDKTHQHHTTFAFNGYFIENHFDFVNIHYGHGNKELEKVFKHLAIDDSNWTEIEGQKVYLPSANLHALFVLRHSILHFASTRMTLRQVLDWAFLVANHNSEIDWAWLTRVLDDYQMTGFFKCINAICVENLGFDVSIFPRFQFDVAMKERVLNDVISPEFFEETPTHIWRRIPFKVRRWQANAWKQNFCYGDSRFKSFWTGVWGHLIKPEMI